MPRAPRAHRSRAGLLPRGGAPGSRARPGATWILLAVLTVQACTFDPSGLRPPSDTDGEVPPTCGNGRLDPPEACDGSELGGASCATLGYFEGALACDTACRLDASACGRCGNGVLEPGEECDLGDFGGQTCEGASGKPDGVLACSLACVLMTELCHRCGDGAVEPAEDCDGVDLNGATCETEGHDGGTLACLPTCLFDPRACFVCGDGTCAYELGESPEQCPADCARWVAITAGARHTCAVRATGLLYCWGDNGQLQLGSPAPPYVSDTPLGLAAPTNALLAEAGTQHGCAVIAGGLLHCWGDNDFGQLGLGATSDHQPPGQVPGLGAVTLVAGGFWHTCAASSSEAPTCWGFNGSGQLGDGTRTGHYYPAAVSGLTALLSLDAGTSHTCAVAAAGGTYCWGQAGQGQLGLGTWEDALLPTVVPGLQDAAVIATGQYHTCAARGDGTVACWGQGSSGQLGIGQYGVFNSPQAVPPLPGGGAVQLAAGRAHSCVLLGDGSVHCTGTNGGGQLGDGSYVQRDVFGVVPGLADVTAIAAGDDHTCAIDAVGVLWCWGQGNNGQLGDGESITRNQPVPVLEP